MLVFAGEAFDIDNEHKRLKSLLIGTHSHYKAVIDLFWLATMCHLYANVGPCPFLSPAL